MDDLIVEKSFEFTFSYELDDFVNAHRARKSLQPYYKLRYMFTLIIIAAIIVELIQFGFLFSTTLMARYTSASPSFDHLIKIGAIILTILIFLLVVSLLNLSETFLRWRIKRAYHETLSIEEEYEVIVDSEGVWVNLQDWKTYMGWPRIQKIYAHQGEFLLFNDDRNYVILPQHAFTDQSQTVDFREFVTQVTGKQVDDID